MGMSDVLMEEDLVLHGFYSLLKRPREWIVTAFCLTGT